MIELPKDILERVERVLDYHRASKHTPQSVQQLKPQTDPATQPLTVRRFPGLPKITLPTSILDLAVPAMPLMREGLPALPESHIRPPQDLKTIATWLHMANGVTAERRFEGHRYALRTCPSAGALFPFEIYLAAFAIDGLEPGIYSYNPAEFTLTKLRDGPETLSQIKRGRPELAFLKSVPAALLVSTIYWRSAWKYRTRGFRVALLDAGHLIANLVAVANGLGIQTMTRLKMNDNTMRELIGLWYEHDFGAFEAVQAMIVWADDANSPLEAPGPPGPPPVLRPIERPPLSTQSVSYGSIVAAHFDCVAPGIPLRDVKPPYTELSPMPAVHTAEEMKRPRDSFLGPSLRQVLLNRRTARAFDHRGIPREKFLAINHAGFRTGTFPPILPNGSYPGLIRPFWIIHSVAGVPGGVWYYHPHTDRWVMLARGDYRGDTAVMCLGQRRCGDAAAMCIMVSNLRIVLNACGPDLYRLAHLEAGIIGQRLALAAAASGIGSCGICTFYDEQLRAFLGLDQTGWEVLYGMAIGIPAVETDPPGHPGLGIG
jgi:SagB-type dehydrogenase family enzyme